ncbi:hypothetical protein WECO103172_10815 [Weissella confusa]
MLIELSSLRSVTNFLSEQDNYDKAYSGPIEYTDEPCSYARFTDRFFSAL